jgi:MYXO-CTERM domain-containing protein
MKSQLFMLIMLVGGCVTEDALDTTTQPVIGGTVTPAGLYPATGALVARVQGQQIVFCTGTLISPDAVATAAHCLIPPPDIGDFSPYFTFARDANAATTADLLPSREKHYHPQYNQNAEPPGTISHTYDIGIVLLSHPVTNVAPAYLPTAAEASALAQGMPLEITGYGLTNATDDNSAGVKYNATTTLAALGQYEIGVGTPGGPQNCHGDSGGPAYIHVGSGLRMLGIVSRGNTGGEDSCDQGGIDTRADAYKSWLSTYTTLVDPPADPGNGSGSGSGGGGDTGNGGGGGNGNDTDPSDPGTSTGGCSTSGAPSVFGIVALTALVRRRRRPKTKRAAEAAL